MAKALLIIDRNIGGLVILYIFETFHNTKFLKSLLIIIFFNYLCSESGLIILCGKFKMSRSSFKCVVVSSQFIFVLILSYFSPSLDPFNKFSCHLY